MTLSLRVKIICLLDACEQEAPDFGSLIGHIAMAHPDVPAVLEIRPRGRRRRTVLASTSDMTPLGDHLTESTIQELESLTGQADTHIRNALRDAEMVRESARLSSVGINEVKARILELHHRIMRLRPDSVQTRKITAANAVAPPVLEEDDDDPLPTQRIRTVAPPVRTPKRLTNEEGGIVVRSMPPVTLPIDDGGGEISNESLMQELHQGPKRKAEY